MHAQARVHEAHEDRPGGPSRRGRKLGLPARALVKGHAIDQEVARVIVDCWRIAGIGGRWNRSRRRRQVAALAGLAVPHVRLAESGRLHGRIHSAVLHRIDLAQHQGQFRVVVDDSRARFVVGDAGSRTGRGRRGHNEYAIKAHRALDGRMRAGFDQIGARFEIVPSEIRGRPEHHFSGERLDAVRLRRRAIGTEGTRASTARDSAAISSRIGSARSGPSRTLSGVRRARRRHRRSAQAAAQLAHDHERGRQRVRAGPCREREIVGQANRQDRIADARRTFRVGNGDDDRRPVSTGIRIRCHAGAGAGSDGAAGVTPHRHRLPVGQHGLGGCGGQADSGLRIRRSGRYQENGSRKS